MKKKLKNQVLDALKKRALGYVSTENIVEYGICDGQLAPLKRRETSKEVPADISAIKLILEETESQGEEELSYSQLLIEKEKILKSLNPDGAEKEQR